MTEPTHIYRPDVEVEVDRLLARVQGSISPLEQGEAWDALRQALARAWRAGEQSGWRESGYEGSRAQNPYDETDIA